MFSFVFQQNFEYDEVKQLIEAAVEPVLGKQIYAPKKIQDWTSTIVESVLKSLQAGAKPFKYVGNEKEYIDVVA